MAWGPNGRTSAFASKRHDQSRSVLFTTGGDRTKRSGPLVEIVWAELSSDEAVASAYEVGQRETAGAG